MLKFNLPKPQVTERVYKKFVDTGYVSETIIILIALKMMKREDLSDLEKGIMFGKTAEINEMIARLHLYNH